MNIPGLIAVALSVVFFALVCRALRARRITERLFWLGVFSVLSIPALWFAIYYLHILPEYAWFYALRSWTGSEFLVLFLGCAAGALASVLPRLLFGLPLFGLLLIASIPYLKLLVAPLPGDAFVGQATGGWCRQSTLSTCGPASIANIIHYLDEGSLPVRKAGLRDPTEREIASQAFTSATGTEAWYLARYLRRYGFKSRFDFRPEGTFAADTASPALVGVRLGGAGHFIAVLSVSPPGAAASEASVKFIDPLDGQLRDLLLAAFRLRYSFTGFHLVVSRPKPVPGAGHS